MSWRDEILDEVERRYQPEVPPFVPGTSYIPASGKVVDATDLRALVDASLDLWLTAGRFAARFERDLARRVGLRWARAVNSGSSANLLAFATLCAQGPDRIEPGSEVITVAAGFPTTVAPIVQHGCVPVFVDVDHRTHNIDVTQLDAALSPRTRAIMVAHALGNPFDVATVARFAAQHGLRLVEDCCDALGATFEGQPVGTFGDLATLSFYPAHHITMGEGGAVLGNSTTLLRIAESLRDWGRDCWCLPGKDNTCGKRFEWNLGSLPAGYDHKYIYTHLGYNLKITDMQAAVGCSQLAKLDHFVERRRANHRYLAEGVRARGLARIFDIVEPTPGSDPSWFGFVLSVRPDAGVTRHDVTRRLEQAGIGTRLVFGGNLARQPAFEHVNFRAVGDLAVTDRVMRDSFWVGVWPGLDNARLDYMLDTFERITGERAA